MDEVDVEMQAIEDMKNGQSAGSAFGCSKNPKMA